MVALLTVSDKAMHTNVNFLMWAAVTALVVLTSLLLGLFWGRERDIGDRALGCRRLTTRTTFQSISFPFEWLCLKYSCRATVWKTAITSGLSRMAVGFLGMNGNREGVGGGPG